MYLGALFCKWEVWLVRRTPWESVHRILIQCGGGYLLVS